MGRHAWALVAAGTALFWGWLVGANAVLPENEPTTALPLALVMVPLAAAALLTIAAGVAGACDPARRAERAPLWLAAVAGGLELVTVVWGYFHDLRGADGGGYAIPLAFATLMLPPAAAWAAAARRFARRPEAVREPVDRRLARGWREATRSWAVMTSHADLLVLPLTSMVLACAFWAGGYVATGALTDGTMPRIALTGMIVLLPGTLEATFLGVAYLAALDRRVRGEKASARDGLAIAWRRRGAVAGWALLSAGVGALLQALQQFKGEWALAPLMSALAGVAWGVLAVFVMPVLALEDVGVRDAIRRTTALVRRRWGEGMGGLGNLTLVGVVLGVPGASPSASRWRSQPGTRRRSWSSPRSGCSSSSR